MFTKRSNSVGSFWGLVVGTSAAVAFHGLSLASGNPAGVKGGWISTAIEFPKEMSQNFWIAIIAFSVTFVVNAGLSWNSASGWSATALYNVVGRRITEGGSIKLPDTYEEARNVIDVSLRVPLMQTLEAKFDAKNVLDDSYRTTQGHLANGTPNYALKYNAGRVFQLGVTWKP
jgi:hypothetical protein